MLHPHRARLIGRDVTQRYALLKPPHHRCHRTSHTSRGRRSVTGAVVVRLATAEGGRVRTHRHRNHHGQCVACGAASRPCSVDGASHGGRTVRVVHVALDGACLQCTHRASRLRGSEAGDTHRLRAARVGEWGVGWTARPQDYPAAPSRPSARVGLTNVHRMPVVWDSASHGA